MEEFLVIFACLNSTGCSETSHHYYSTHPQVQEAVKRGERIAKKYIGPVIIETVGPTLLFVAGGTGHVRLHSNISLKINQDGAILGFVKEF